MQRPQGFQKRKEETQRLSLQRRSRPHGVQSLKHLFKAVAGAALQQVGKRCGALRRAAATKSLSSSRCRRV